MSHEDYQKAAEHWDKIDAKSAAMPREQLLKAITDYIGKNNTCALATGSGQFVRCTPIEYAYHDGAFFLFSEGGRKFVGLEKNKRVSLAIFDKYEGFGHPLFGLQVSGVAEVVEPFSPAYNAEAASKKIPLDALKKLPEPLHLIKIVPTRFDFLDSELKKEGYSSRQCLSVSR